MSGGPPLVTGSDPAPVWWRRPTPRPLLQPGYAVREDKAAAGVAFWALMTFMCILVLAPQSVFPPLATFRIALLAASVAVFAHSLDRWTSGRPITVVTREMKIAICLLGWAIVTIPFSLWPGGSVAVLTDQFLKSLVLFWLIANTVSTIRRFRQFAWGLILLSMPIATSALLSYVSGTFVPGSSRIYGYDAPLTANPNDLALTLNLIIPFGLGLVWLTRSAVLRAALLAILLLDITVVVITFSRAGFLAVAVILVVTVARLLRSPRRAWGIALLVVLPLCLPLLPASYWHRLTTITDIESDETGSAQARRENSLGALRFLITHPVVGAGIGSDALALNAEVGPTWTVVHNVYLQYGVDLGLPGLGLFLALFVT